MICGKQDIDSIASDLAKGLNIGDIVLLFGDLGTGKTFFTNKLCKHLGAKDIVNSPSYVLLNEYMAPTHPIYHYDLYRLSCASEAVELGILERLTEGITIIEWPELIIDLLPEKRIEVHLEHAGNKRNIIINR